MLFISPPFSNYFSLPKTTVIKGSYTLYPRAGLLTQIFKTLRYSSVDGGWINKIGLRNKGLDYAIRHYQPGEIISIAILQEKDIDIIINKIPQNMDLELNISCPNLNHDLINVGLKKFINPERQWCIIKLPPLISIDLVDNYYREGFRQFHCCNTLPVQNGGLSGPVLIPYVTKLLQQIKKKYPDTTLIAGGGIRILPTARNYLNNGADHISVSSLCFNPFMFGMFYYQWYQFDKST